MELLPFVIERFIYWLLQNGVNKNQQKKSCQRETKHDKFFIFAIRVCM